MMTNKYFLCFQLKIHNYPTDIKQYSLPVYLMFESRCGRSTGEKQHFLPTKKDVQISSCLMNMRMIEKRKIYVRTNMSIFKIRIYLKQYEG